jgi:hypothetical protein
MSVSNTPFIGTITLAAANTPYNIATLLAGLSNPPEPLPVSGLLKACLIQLQGGGGQAGSAANFYLGNSNVSSATPTGFWFVAGQAFTLPESQSNLFILNQMYLATDTPGATVNILFITR